MIAEILTLVSLFIIGTINMLGYGGVILLMAIESACIPLPSEIIMPFAGSLVPQRFTLWGLGLAGALGCVLGSLVAYGVGMYGGRPLIVRYGRYVLISRHDLDLADRWFDKYGESIVFTARLLPIIRTFIAFPAGVARMNLARFVIYTFLGSYPWCYGLAYVGKVLGDNWEKVRDYFHTFDLLIGGLIVLGIVWWIRRHVRLERSAGERA
jgi:membrane protein DedA with SNARE-associated domain